MNNKGQIIITDLLLYLIVLTLILSFIIYTTSTINDNQINRVNNKETHDLLENTLSTLTKTSGNPTNWEYLNTNNIKTIGLKSDKNQVSYNKLTKLKQNKELMDDFFPKGIDYSLTIYPKNNPNNKELIAGKEYLTNKKQIQSKEVEIIIDYAFKTIALSHNTTNLCPYNHDNTWKCKNITITETLLEQGKYYIITNSNTEYIISNTYMDNITGQTNNIININNQIKQLQKSDNQTIYIHIKSNTNNTCLAFDSNNRDEYLESIINPEIYILNLKVAT